MDFLDNNLQIEYSCMKLFATLKKDVVVNQSDFQEKKKKRKTLSKKEYRNRFAFKTSL